VAGQQEPAKDGLPSGPWAGSAGEKDVLGCALGYGTQRLEFKISRVVEMYSWVDEAAELDERLVDPGPRIAMKRLGKMLCR
jgi:hypothetical protein